MRAQQAVDRKRVRAGTKSGDPKALMARDAGPVRAAVRDIVDGRRNLAVLLLPIAVLLLAAQVSGSRSSLAVATWVWTASLVALILDELNLAATIRRSVRSRFPDQSSARGHVGYGLLRSTQFRRLRMPPPRVTPGPLRLRRPRR